MIDNTRRSFYTKDYYNWIVYFKEFKETKVLSRILKMVFGASSIQRDAVVLDIGCGRGDLISHLSINCRGVYGLDYSENALLFSKETVGRLPDNQRKKICLLCADACQLPFKDNALDYIFSVDVFEHLKDNELKSLVKEMHRILKKGGRFIVHTSPNKKYVDIGYRYWIRPINIIFNPLSKIIFKRKLMIVDHYREPTHINLLSVKSLQRLFKNSGFKVRVYTRWFLPDNFIGYVYKIISQLWPITLFFPMRNLFCPFLWAEGEKCGSLILKMNNLNNFDKAIAGNPDIHTEVLQLTRNYQGAILDLGAGQGGFTKKLIEQGHINIYACDKRPEYFRVKGLICSRCDLNHEALPYSANFFDMVVCTEVIEHLENPRRLLREIHKVLKTKGGVIISTPNSLSLRGRLSFLFRGYSSYCKKMYDWEESEHITLLSRHDLLRIFREMGFKVLKIVYTRGTIPKFHVLWQSIFSFLKGELFSDTIIILAGKS